jgi:hypothetical protein
MQESEYQPLGTVSGTEVGVQASLIGQDILIQHTDTGHRLARLLQPEAARTVLRGIPSSGVSPTTARSTPCWSS